MLLVILVVVVVVIIVIEVEDAVVVVVVVIEVEDAVEVEVVGVDLRDCEELVALGKVVLIEQAIEIVVYTVGVILIDQPVAVVIATEELNVIGLERDVLEVVVIEVSYVLEVVVIEVEVPYVLDIVSVEIILVDVKPEDILQAIQTILATVATIVIFSYCGYRNREYQRQHSEHKP